MEKMSLNVIADKELTIREGSAPDIIIPTGQVVEFIPSFFPELVKKKTFNPEVTLVKYSINQGLITIESNIKSPYQKGIDTYKGTYRINEKLHSFKINKDHMWNLKSLGDHIKMNRNLFPDPDKALVIAAQFKTLTATVNQKIERHKDDRANSLDRFEQEVQSNLPEFFIMEAPILLGEDHKEQFKVDVNFNVRGKEVEVFLTSFELTEIWEKSIKTQIESILNEIRTTQPDLIILRTS